MHVCMYVCMYVLVLGLSLIKKSIHCAISSGAYKYTVYIGCDYPGTTSKAKICNRRGRPGYSARYVCMYIDTFSFY